MNSRLKFALPAVVAVIAAFIALFHYSYGEGNGPSANASGVSAPGQTATDQAPAPVVAPQSPEEDMLRAGLDHVAYLEVGVNFQSQYCEPLNSQDYAQISVHPMTGEASPLINRIATTLSEHVAVMAVVKPTFASQSDGLISGGTCYAVDPNLVQRYRPPGLAMLMPLGRIKVTDIQLVNEYPAYGPTGPTQARSYHVDYFVGNDLADGHLLPGVSLIARRATCVLIHDNVENRWSFQSCQ